MILALSTDGCPHCESVAADAEESSVYIDWIKTNASNAPEMCSELLSAIMMKTDNPDDMQLPAVLLLGESAVEVFCRLWQTVPEEVRESLCKDGVCSLPKGQTWDFADDI